LGLNYLIRIRDPGWKNSDPEWKKLGSGIEKIRIRDKHPGSAILVFTTFRAGFMVWYDNVTCPVDIGGRRICLKYVNIETGVIEEKAKT
jgi:hypothetical protein